VEIVFRGNRFEGPVGVVQKERSCPLDTRELIIVQEDDSTRMQEAIQIGQVEEHPIEPVVAVDEGQVEVPSLAQEPRERDLRFFGVVLDEVVDPASARN